MKKILSVMLVLFMVLAVSCGSGDKKDGKKSKLEKRIEMIRNDNPNKPVQQMVKILKIEGENGENGENVQAVKKAAIMEIYSEIMGKTTPHQLPEFKESPNRNIKVPGNVARIHLASDYSANAMLFLMKGKEMKVFDELRFNTDDSKYDFAPGHYDFVIIVDRQDNDNVYVFQYDSDFTGGKLYLGKFRMDSKYIVDGECMQGYIRDTDICIAPSFKIFDNCDAGTHLVEHLCCEEGFNFIMDGQCSRYSDAVENVICPAGYHEAGKGRCCPTGELFIDNKCQKPTKEEPAK